MTLNQVERDRHNGRIVVKLFLALWPKARKLNKSFLRTFSPSNLDTKSITNAAKMAWRSQGITGSNNIPLGTRRRFGGDDDGAKNGDYASPASNGTSDSYKRGRSPTRGTSTSSQYSQSTNF